MRFIHVSTLRRLSIASLCLGVAACVVVGRPGSSGHGGRDRSGAASSSAPGDVFSTVHGDGAGDLVGDIVWSGRPLIQDPHDIVGRLIGPGSDGKPRPLTCLMELCALGRDSFGWDINGLPGGNYVIELRLQDRTQDKVLAHAEVEFVAMPTVGGATKLEATVTAHLGTLETSYTKTNMWLPVDKRQPNRMVTYVVIDHGKVTAARSVKLPGPELDGPLLDYEPVAVPGPGTSDGVELFLIWNDSKELAGHFQLAAKHQDKNGPPWSIIAATPAAPDLVALAAASLPPGAPPHKPRSEAWACAVSLDPAAGPIVKRILAAEHEQRRGFAGAMAASDQSMYDSDKRAQREGRDVTQSERDTADRLGEAGAAANLPRAGALQTEIDHLRARLDQLASKQKPGCMAAAVPESFKAAARAKP